MHHLVVAVHRHRGLNVARAAGDVAAHLCVGACAIGVNYEFTLARRSAGHVGHADVGPAVELTDDLVVAQIAGNDGLDNLVRRHVRHTKVSRATYPMLAGIFRSNSVVYGFGPKRRVDHNRLAQERADLLKELSQALKVCNF